MMAQGNTPIDITPDAVLDGVHHHMNRTRTHLSRKQGSLQAADVHRINLGACITCIVKFVGRVSQSPGCHVGVLNLGGSWRFFEVKQDGWSIVITTCLSGLEVLEGVI